MIKTTVFLRGGKMFVALLQPKFLYMPPGDEAFVSHENEKRPGTPDVSSRGTVFVRDRTVTPRRGYRLNTFPVVSVRMSPPSPVTRRGRGKRTDDIPCAPFNTSTFSGKNFRFRNTFGIKRSFRPSYKR